MTEIAVGELTSLLRGRMGLVFGPGLRNSSLTLSALSRHLASQYSVDQGGDLFDVGDRIIASGVSEEEVRTAIRNLLGRQAAQPKLDALARPRWSAILSSSLDNQLETLLEEEAVRRPTRRRLAVLGDLMQQPPPRTVPVFKLLGRVSQDDFSCCTASYHMRRIGWRHAIRGFSEQVRGNPVLCIGMGDTTRIFFDLLTEMLGEPVTIFANLVMLTDEPICQDKRVTQLLEARTKILTTRGSLGDVCKAIADADEVGYSRYVPLETKKGGDYEALAEYSDVVAVVNEHLETKISVEERNRLLDILFSPSVPRWDAHVHGLDFPRTLGRELTTTLNEQLSAKDFEDAACVVKGSASSGKTMLLKRVAFDVATAGHLVFWLKQWYHPDSYRVLRDLFASAKSLEKHHFRRVAVFVDDPVDFGTSTVGNVVRAAQDNGIDLLLVAGVRTSDWDTSDHGEPVGGLSVIEERTLSETLNVEEWQSLPEYLISLGLAEDEAGARGKLTSAPDRTTQDTLGMLYWLLPATRRHIESSIRDEYFRLGDYAGLKKVVVGSTEYTSTMLKEAYEFVAVADYYRAPLPIEVLVSALGVGYEPWLNVTSKEGPAWGILYAHEDENGAAYYRTRNAIVTRMLVETINGGALGHARDCQILQKLIANCTGSSSVYREFCVRVLVPQRKIEFLDYEDGLRLYDAAITALPFPDKTLLHHKALWVKDKGRQPIEAKQILTQALTTPVYPYAKRGESNQHIHNSLAACTLDAADQKIIDLRTAKQEMESHLAKARAENFFNPRAVHVQARLTTRLAASDEADTNADTFTLINQSLADIDRTLIILQNPVDRSKCGLTDVQLLEGVRENLFDSLSNIEDLDVEASRLWDDYANQEGFVLQARKLYRRAINSNRGSHFNEADDYCRKAMRLIEECNAKPSRELCEVAVQIYFHWRVLRAIFSGTDVLIDWELLRTGSAQTLSDATVSFNSLLMHFIHALALAHQDQWPDANAIFMKLRQTNISGDVIWAPRAFLMDSRGKARQVQGVIKEGVKQQFLHVEDLHLDFHLAQRGRWANPGEIDYAYIQFAFAGPTAIDRL